MGTQNKYNIQTAALKSFVYLEQIGIMLYIWRNFQMTYSDNMQREISPICVTTCQQWEKLWEYSP